MIIFVLFGFIRAQNVDDIANIPRCSVEENMLKEMLDNMLNKE
jgi:hypothetical protein